MAIVTEIWIFSRLSFRIQNEQARGKDADMKKKP